MGNVKRNSYDPFPVGHFIRNEQGMLGFSFSLGEHPFSNSNTVDQNTHIHRRMGGGNEATRAHP